MPTSTLSIPELKAAILLRARERQAAIERGEYDVPLRYAPLPLSELADYLSQWEYRRDSLNLAVPPPASGLGARLSRFCKSLVCKSLRWLLMRQVEFNTAALQHGRFVADYLAAVDRNEAELVAALTNLKMQVHSLAERVIRLERTPAPDVPSAPPSMDPCENLLALHRLYLTHLSAPETHASHLPGALDTAPEEKRGKALRVVVGSRYGDLLKLLISEGIVAQGVANDPAVLEHYRERELPVVAGDIVDYLDGSDDDSLSGAVVERRACDGGAQQLRDILRLCWRKLRKGGVVIVETDNPQHSAILTGSSQALPVELMQFLFESQCLGMLDTIFSLPTHFGAAGVVRAGAAAPFDLKHYRRYAVVGCK